MENPIARAVSRILAAFRAPPPPPRTALEMAYADGYNSADLQPCPYAEPALAVAYRAGRAEMDHLQSWAW